MKTLYCLGGAPQFRLPCIRYHYLIKKREKKNISLFPKKNLIIKDFYNMNTSEENKKEKLVDEWIDQIYPMRSIKRCLEINPTIKIKMRKFYRTLRESLSVDKNKTKTKINEKDNKNDDNENDKALITNDNKDNNNNNNNDKENNYKCTFNKNNNSNCETITNYNNKVMKKEGNSKIQTRNNRNTPKKIQTDNSSLKLCNYNYPISNESDVFRTLISSKNKAKKNLHLLLCNNYNNNINDYNNSKFIYNIKYLNDYYKKNKNGKNIFNEFSQTSYKTNPKRSKKIKKNNSIDIIIRKRRKRRNHNQQNKLNIIYSENEDQFYRKYDKYRKNKFLNGLCLTHVNCSPKVLLKELDEKINLIKNKVGIVKSIVDKTFPKVLANISMTKKEFQRNQGKEGYNSPYIEKLNKIKKEQNNLDLYFSIPVEVLSRNRNSNFGKKKKILSL
jgi:hypothetical protein